MLKYFILTAEALLMTAIVTGASSVLGREFVKDLAAEKKYEEIWLIARRKEELLSLAQSGVRAIKCWL